MTLHRTDPHARLSPRPIPTEDFTREETYKHTRAPVDLAFTGGPGSPFGGYKQSGIGRERGLMALQNYTQVKNVVVRVGGSPGPEGRE